MSLARGKFEQPKQPTVKAKTVEVVNKLGRGISKVAKSGPLDFIAVFCFITTAIGELIGREYGVDWYVILFILLIILFIKEANLLTKENGGPKRENLQQDSANCGEHRQAGSAARTH